MTVDSLRAGGFLPGGLPAGGPLLTGSVRVVLRCAACDQGDQGDQGGQ